MKNKIQSKNKEIVLNGLAVSPGIAIGSVFIFRTLKINVHELQAEVDDPKSVGFCPGFQPKTIR